MERDNLLKTLKGEAIAFEQLKAIPPSPPSQGGDKRNCLKVPLLKGDLGGSETLKGEASELEKRISENVTLLLGQG